LSLSVVQGEPSSPLAKTVSNQIYQLNPNSEGYSTLVVSFDSDNQSLKLESGEKAITIPFETGKLKSSNPDPSGTSGPMASSAAWTSPDNLQIRSYLYETPFYNTYNIVFDKDEVSLTRKSNVSFGPAAVLELKGKKK
jgi:hypothetical protein